MPVQIPRRAAADRGAVMMSARKIADRIAMIHKGRIIRAGPVAEIDHSGNEYVDRFINGRAEGPIQMEVREP